MAVTACTGVVLAASSPPACSNDSAAGLGIKVPAPTTTRSASAIWNAMTSSPTEILPAGPSTSGPTAATTPAASRPRRIGSAGGSSPICPL